MFVFGNTLTVFGGISEIQDKEVTFDDCWTLDLNARDKWVRKIEGTMDKQEWLGEDEEEDDEDDEFNSSDYNSGDSSDDSCSESEREDDREEEKEEILEKKSKKGKNLKEKMEKIRSDHDLNETFTPLVGETLKEFTARTASHWNQLVISNATAEDRIDINDKKEIRRLAFALAGKRFEETASILAKLKEYEEEQAELESKDNRKKSSSKKN